MKQIDPQTSLQCLHDNGPKLAQVKAERTYLDEYRKSLKAILMSKSTQTSAAMQERDAYAHPEYLDHLEALRDAVEREEFLRWKMVTAQAAIDVWRSMNASNRQMDRAAA